MKTNRLRILWGLILLPFSAFAQVAGNDGFDIGRETYPVPKNVLKINEVMFNPTKNGADYVELYNTRSLEYVSDSFCIVRWIGDSLGRRHPFPAGIRIPGYSCVVLTTDTAFLFGQFHVENPELVMPMSSMPPLPDRQGTVLVYSVSGALQDRFDYNEQMHNPLLRNKENVALERSDLYVETNNPEIWHSASSGSGYGTPTALNSQAFPWWELDVELSSELISPDGDGYQDELTISILSPWISLSANITILDREGRVVRHLMRNGLLGTHDSFVWDGLDDHKTCCRRGTYVVLIEAYNRTDVHWVKRYAVSLVD